MKKLKSTMHFNLHITYWSLLSVTFISSCFLFFVVASENAKYVAATTTAADAANKVVPAATTNTAAAAPGLTTTGSSCTATIASDSAAEQCVLPNYKKVKKLQQEPGASNVPPGKLAASKGTSGFANEPAAVAREEPAEVAAEFKSNVLKQQLDSPQTVNVATEVNKSGAVDAAAEAHSDESDKRAVSQEESEQIVAKTKEALSSAKPPHTTQSAESLPDITEIPTVTVTDIPLEVLAPQLSGLDAIIIDTGGKETAQELENRTAAHLLEDTEQAAVQKDEQIIKFNDSGGDMALNADTAEIGSGSGATNIPSENATDSVVDTDAQQPPNANLTAADDAPAASVNLTAEEVPIPVFSEWAQKQMEAAEKQQAKEQEDGNTATQKKNHTNGNGKAPPLKIRAKNYASPDCGAKIIASNADASNTGAVLSSSKDEYMLSPCGNRIWFVVELCEAIQAQKVELANFELFSSSPKNFTVAVSNRFPSRDWSNVGRFIAEDKRNIQSFELHPHLFGKFVRVDIHSHYSKEHFCPVSLFRVFGTSEFEAFETENHPNEDLDDFDDEFGLEQAHTKISEPNLFKSASDAVLSIVKKAAEVLVKPTSSQNQTLTVQTRTLVCRTPAFGQFSCAECNHSLVERINSALSCEFQQLNHLLSVERLRKDLLHTQVCAKQYGLEASVLHGYEEADYSDDCKTTRLLGNPFQMDLKQSYYLNLLPIDYIGALCQLMAERQADSRKSHTHSAVRDADKDADAAELALNLTIDKKTHVNDFQLADTAAERKLLNPETVFPSSSGSTLTESAELEHAAANEPQQTPTVTENNAEEIVDQLPRPTDLEDVPEATSTPAPVEMPKETAPDVNIFNVPDVEKEEVISTSTETASIEESFTEQTTTEVPIITSSSSPAKSDEDANAWDSLDNLLTPTVSPPAMADSAGQAGHNSNNLQQKLPSGPQSESVFIRLSNRIKALERNMSLSGQYLEELSRRYKKQVEELQQTLTQQTQTVRTLEEQNRRHNELEQLYAQRNSQLKHELDDLSLQVHACIVVIIFVGAFVFLVLMVGILFYRSLRRETKELLTLQTASSGKRKPTTATSGTVATQKKLNRRKSFEDFSDKQQTLSKSSEKQRRPSEEAMLILKDCGDMDGCAALEQVGDMQHAVSGRAQPGQHMRHRKISVYNVNNSNHNGNTSSSSANNNGKRRGTAAAEQTCAQQPQQQWQQLVAQQQQAKQFDHFIAAGASYPKTKSTQSTNGQQAEQQPKSSKAKKKAQNLKRQESAPGAYTAELRLNVTTPADYNSSNSNNSLLLLDEEDLDNFIPNADLTYNEFMPEGPSGYQIVSENAEKSEKNAAANKKSRRLSSPAFFKSPFSKALKPKATTPSKGNTPHESTSWEWYRLRRSEAQQQKYLLHTSASATEGFQRASPVASLDSSSLSEINFENTNPSDNSLRWRMRVLEEAILTAGEGAITNTATAGAGAAAITTTAAAAAATTTTGNNGHSSGSSSNHSSTSSSSKKKNRSFNRIFRKVF